jgi:hypothetical protein
MLQEINTGVGDSQAGGEGRTGEPRQTFGSGNQVRTAATPVIS